MNRISISLLLVILITTPPGPSRGQTHLPETALRELNLSYYLSTEFLKRLELSELQISEISNLQQRVLQWKSTPDHDLLLMSHQENEIKKIRGQFTSELFAILNNAQETHLKHYILAKYYQMYGTSKLEDYGIDPIRTNAPPWFDPRVAKELKLTAQQRQQFITDVRKILDEENLRLQKNQAILSNYFLTWQKDLKTLLTKKQRDQFQSSLGEKFSFPKKLQTVFDVAYRQGPLCLRLNEPSVFRGLVEGGGKRFYLANTVSKIDGSPHPEVLLFLLQLKETKEGLGLSEKQVSDIAEIEQRWNHVRPYNGVITVQNSFGIGKSRQEYSLPEKEIKRFIKDIHSNLRPLQQKRLRQIRNQVVIKLGWKEVPLAHPSWPATLNLTKEKTAVYHKTNRRKLAGYRKLVQKLDEKNNQYRQRIAERTSNILNEKQITAAAKLFGPYWHGEGLDQ